MKKERDYKDEYQSYHGNPSKIKERASRNKARAIMKKRGKVSKGDGKHVDHVNNNPMDNSNGNLRVVTRKKNLTKAKG